MPLKLIIIRGLPGSGKSTLARSFGLPHYEADMYFIDGAGQYRFDSRQLPAAHRWCQQQVEACLSCGQSVVVANTFVQRWEMAPYLAMAKRYQASIEVNVCKGKFRNIHDVPKSVTLNMLKNWED